MPFDGIPDSTTKTQRALVWDLPVRIFHWALVLSVVAAFVTNKLGVAYFRYHVWCGYAVIVLVSFRIVWGLVGTYHARFRNFLRKPRETWRYTRGFVRGSQRHYAGHNPLGALMVVALLLMLLAQAITGLFGNDEIFNVGPLYGYISNELSLKLTSWHRQLFYWIVGAIALHVLAVIAHSIAKRDNLIAAMLHGKKPHHKLRENDVIHSSRIGLAVAIAVVLSLLLAWVVTNAPVAVTDVSY